LSDTLLAFGSVSATEHEEGRALCLRLYAMLTRLGGCGG
jgi:hypothetical protein